MHSTVIKLEAANWKEYFSISNPFEKTDNFQRSSNTNIRGREIFVKFNKLGFKINGRGGGGGRDFKNPLISVMNEKRDINV